MSTVAPTDSPSDDRPLHQLGDGDDREELRARYYGLLQELRIVLPGVQVLLAFLLTVPFTERFDQVDDLGHALFAIALLGTALSVVCLVSPILLHRMGERTARQERLQWGIRLAVAGSIALAISITTALWCVTRTVYDPTLAFGLAAGVGATITGLWFVLPRQLGSSSR